MIITLHEISRQGIFIGKKADSFSKATGDTDFAEYLLPNSNCKTKETPEF